jgi:hypothetical protein
MAGVGAWVIASQARQAYFGCTWRITWKCPRHVVQYLGHVLAELAHSAATGWTDAGGLTGGLMQHLLPWQVIGEGFAPWLCAHRDRRLGLAGLGVGDILGLAGLQLLQPQLELLDLSGDPLRGLAKLHAAQLGDLKAQFFNLQRLELHRGLRGLELTLARRCEGAQSGGIGGQSGRGERHARIYQDHRAEPESMRNR